jgi:uncharacterized protein
MVGSWISFVGFAFGILMTNLGIFAPAQEYLRHSIAGPSGGPATAPHVLGVSPWAVIAVLVVLGGLWLWRGHRKTYQGGWSWIVTGVAIGVIGVIAWVLSAETGRPFGLSVTEPAYTYIRFLGLGQWSALNWASFMWVGIPVGAFLAARRHREFKWRVPAPQRTLQALGGGVVMGIGAAIAGGCNVGHSLTGVATLSLTSITASLGIVAGVWSAAAVLFRA